MGQHLAWPICNFCQGGGQVTAQHAADGKGIKGEPCPRCNGIGRIRPEGWVETKVEPCRACKGAGSVITTVGSDLKYERTYQEAHKAATARGLPHADAHAEAHAAGLEAALAAPAKGIGPKD